MSVIDDGGRPPQRPEGVRPPAPHPAQAQPLPRPPRGDYYADTFERVPASRIHAPGPCSGTPPPPTAVDLNRPPAGSNVSASTWRHLPPEDRQAVWDDHLRAQPSNAAGGTDAQAGCTNPELAAFLAQHPEMATNQDFIDYFWLDKGGTGRSGWGALAEGCARLGVQPSDVTNYRSASIRDLAYPPPPPDGSLPLTAEEARRFHIVQFTDPTYNPSGPASSVNCGPASLAMALDTQGLMPPGLTPEQKVDYARGLMYGTYSEEVVVLGRTIRLLDEDHATTGSGDVLNGAEAAGLAAREQSGWSELDAALAAGKPVVAYGDCYQDWKDQFPTEDARYGSGEIAHFIAILGRTADGSYIVSDPMFTGGPVEMTRDQLSVFFDKDDDNTARFVSMDPVRQVPSDQELRGYRYQME